VDFHAHPFIQSTYLSDWIESAASSHIDQLHLGESITQKNAWRRHVRELQTAPFFRSIVNYVARVYDCEPNIEKVDNVLSKEYDSDFTEYIRTVLDRENISKVQLISETATGDVGEFPKDRYVWAYNIGKIISLDWVKDKDARNLDDILDLVNEELQTCVKNNCKGLKNHIAYHRTLVIDGSITSDQANAAYKKLLDAEPRFSPSRLYDYALTNPNFENSRDTKYLTIYEDYLLKYLIVQAGRLGLSFHFHTGAMNSPILDLRRANPIDLLPIIYDVDVNKADTKIVILHGGYPFVDVAISIATEFPNVYIDTSWPCHSPIIGEILRPGLELLSPRKILYGSDSSLIPERLGLGAWNTRKLLTGILNDLIDKGLFSEEQCFEIAERILHKNAQDILDM
jgi:hypothetical protein